MSNVPESIALAPEVSAIDDARAQRTGRVWSLVCCLVLFWLIAGGVYCYMAGVRGLEHLDGNLMQTVTAFRHTMASNCEWISGTAEIVAMDPCWLKHCSDKPGEVVPDEDFVQKHLAETLNSTDCGLFILLDNKFRVVRVGVRQSVAARPEKKDAAAQQPAEGENAGEASSPEFKLPEVGTVIDTPPVKAAFEFGEGQIGFWNLQENGGLCGTVVMPLSDGKGHVKGAFILGEPLNSKLLNDYCPGAFGGVMAVIINRSVVSTLDKRTARGAAPALLSSLEEACSTWTPSTEVVRDTLSSKVYDALAPSTLEVAGRDWRSLAVELSNGKEQVGWVLFLADTNSLDRENSWNIWFFVACIVLFIPVCFGLCWRKVA